MNSQRGSERPADDARVIRDRASAADAELGRRSVVNTDSSQAMLCAMTKKDEPYPDSLPANFWVEHLVLSGPAAVGGVPVKNQTGRIFVAYGTGTGDPPAEGDEVVVRWVANRYTFIGGSSG